MTLVSADAAKKEQHKPRLVSTASLITIVIFAIGLISSGFAGVLSYNNWRTHSEDNQILFSTRLTEIQSRLDKITDVLIVLDSRTTRIETNDIYLGKQLDTDTRAIEELRGDFNQLKFDLSAHGTGVSR